MNRSPWAAAFLFLLGSTLALNAFEQPPEAERLRALGLLNYEPAALQRLLTPDSDFAPTRSPGAHDWLTLHEEPGQTFDDFFASKPNQPDAKHRIIYLQPIGEFPSKTSPRLSDLRAYAAAFFQLPVKVLPAVIPAADEFEPRQNPRSGDRQILTRRVLKFLQTRLPPDAFCILGVTMTDLYPDPSWNYVFGEASLRERVGIYSFARHDPAFWADPRPSDNEELILRRGCKVLAHETAHMFGLPHCIYYDCLVNGGNHLVEFDATPQHLCPVCLRKLHQSVGFDPVKRYEELSRFYRRHDWREDADWVAHQLSKVSPAKAPKK